MGWSEAQFWDSDFPTLAEALRVKREYDSEVVKASWEQARWMVSVLIAPHNKGKQMKLEKLITFPWDVAPEKTKPEDYDKVVKKLGKT